MKALGRKRNIAVPALVNCAVPSRWMPVQEAAEASQKFTCPSVSAVVPASTVAVNVTTVPPATDDTGFPPELLKEWLPWPEMPGLAGALHTKRRKRSRVHNETN